MVFNNWHCPWLFPNLSSRPFSVNVKVVSLLCTTGLRVLGPFFLSCTPPLSVHSSHIFLQITICTLMIHNFPFLSSFRCTSSIPYFHGALQQISSWLTSNLFVFLNIWIYLYWSPIATSQTTEYFSEYYPLCSQPWLYFRCLLIRYHHSIGPGTITFVNCAAFVSTLTLKQPTPSPLLPYIPNSITVTVYFNLPKTQR